MTDQATEVPVTFIERPSAIQTAKSSIKGSLLLKILFVVLFLGLCAWATAFVIYKREDISVNDEAESIRKISQQLQSDIKGVTTKVQTETEKAKDLRLRGEEKTKEISQYNTKNSELEKEKTELDTKIAELKKSKSSNEAKISQLKSEVAQKQSEIETLAKQVTTLTEQKSAKEAEIASISGQLLYYKIGTGVSVAANVGGAIDAFIVYPKLNTAKENATILEAHVNALINERSGYEHQIDILTKNITDLEYAREENQHEINKLSEEASKIQKEVKILDNKRDALKKECDALTQTLKELAESYNTWCQKYDRMQQDYADLQVKYTKIQEDYKKVSEDYVVLNGKLTELNKAFEALTAEYNKLDVVYKALEVEHNELSGKYTALSKIYRDALSAYTTVEKHYMELQTEYKGNETEFTQISKSYGELNTTYHDLLGRYNTLNDVYKALQTENTVLKTKVNTIKANKDLIATRLYYTALDKIRFQLLAKTNSISASLKEIKFNSAVDGFRADKLKDAVTNIANIVILIATNDGYYFGAFFPKEMKQSTGEHIDSGAFSFSMNNSETCSIVTDKAAYKMSDSKMFTIGVNDIVIDNQADDTKVKSYTWGAITPDGSFHIPDGFDKTKFYYPGTVANITKMIAYRVEFTGATE